MTKPKESAATGSGAQSAAETNGAETPLETAAAKPAAPSKAAPQAVKPGRSPSAAQIKAKQATVKNAEGMDALQLGKSYLFKSTRSDVVIGKTAEGEPRFMPAEGMTGVLTRVNAQLVREGVLTASPAA